LIQPFDSEGAASILKLAKIATAIFERRQMENSVKELFERYEKLFRMALADAVDMARWHLHMPLRSSLHLRPASASARMTST
jgi:hypothetical protein